MNFDIKPTENIQNGGAPTFFSSGFKTVFDCVVERRATYKSAQESTTKLGSLRLLLVTVPYLKKKVIV